MLNESGHEVLDATPASVSIPFRRPEPIHLRLRRMIMQYSQQQHEGHESFEDADDFAVGDPADFEDSRTPYEEHFDHIGNPPQQQAEAPPSPAEPATLEAVPDKPVDTPG
jgi:hypothetical protein